MKGLAKQQILGIVRMVPIIGHLTSWCYSQMRSDSATEGLLRGAALSHRFRTVGANLVIGRSVKLHNAGQIELGDHVAIYDGVYLNAESEIVIGSGSHIDVYTSIYGHGGVEIGNNCAIAAGVRIYSQSNSHGLGTHVNIVDQPRVYKKVIIGSDVWIGANAIILPGVVIESHSVIGAGAVVTSNIPSSSIAVGIPARVISSRPYQVSV